MFLSAENPITSTVETEIPGTIRLTPNPAADGFQIDRSEGFSENAQVRVFSADGRMVFEQAMSSDKMLIKTAGWKDGVYFVHMSDGKAQWVERLVLKKP